MKLLFVGIFTILPLVICNSQIKKVHNVEIERGETKAEKLIRLGKSDELAHIHRLSVSSGQQGILTDYYDNE